MKVVITGGAGFIGSHLAQALCARGAEVVALDNLSLGNTGNLAWKKSGDALDFIEGDVRDQKLLNKILPGTDCLFHQGALPSVPRSVLEPIETNDQNVNGTLTALVCARDAGVRRVLFASSSSIYGNAAAAAKDEMLPPDPLSPYALQKYAGEKYCQLFWRLYGLETVSLRYFNVFGPRQAFNSPYSGVIAKFCTAMLDKTVPVIYGDGLQSRDFSYIENVVEGNLAAMEAPKEQVAGEVFNVACGESVSLLQLVEELNGLTGQNLRAAFQPERTGDVRSSLAEISKARQRFGYAVKVRWQEGLRRTLEFYRAGRSAGPFSHGA
jgi:UDP-glucose 4-epimerase